MGKPKSPKAPDPIETGKAQTGTNVATAIANQVGQMVGQNTPYGSKSYEQSGNFTFTDPTSGQSYSLPRWTENVTLTPDGQYLQQGQIATQKNLSDLAVSQSGRLSNLLAAPLDTSGMPARPQAPELAMQAFNHGAARKNIAGAGNIQGNLNTGPNAQRNIAGAGNIQSNLNTGPNAQRRIAGAGNIQSNLNTGPNAQRNIAGAGAITRSYNNDFSQDRANVEAALMSRLNPQMAQDRASLENRLRQQGITPGSSAWDREMDQIGRAQTDARMQAILAGGQEQSRMVGLEANRAAFQNAAQGQQFGQNATRTQFANDAIQQDFARRQAAATFGNAAQNQQFGQNAAQAQFGNEALQQDFARRQAAGTFANAAQGQQFGQNAAQAQFGNEALQQDFARRQAAGTFANAAQNQQFGQNAAQQQAYNSGLAQNQDRAFRMAAFGNTAAQQQWQMQNDARNAAMNEAFQLRQSPINEIMALQSGSQVQTPTFGQTPGLTLPTTDYAGLMQQDYANRVGAYNTQLGSWNGLWGGLLGAGSKIATGGLL